MHSFTPIPSFDTKYVPTRAKNEIYLFIFRITVPQTQHFLGYTEAGMQGSQVGRIKLLALATSIGD